MRIIRRLNVALLMVPVAATRCTKRSKASSSCTYFPCDAQVFFGRIRGGAKARLDIAAVTAIFSARSRRFLDDSGLPIVDEALKLLLRTAKDLWICKARYMHWVAHDGDGKNHMRRWSATQALETSCRWDV